MNAFENARPRGQDAPSKPPRPVSLAPLPPHQQLRLRDSKGSLTISLERRPMHMHIENREESQRSNDRERKLSKAAI